MYIVGCLWSSQKNLKMYPYMDHATSEEKNIKWSRCWQHLYHKLFHLGINLIHVFFMHVTTPISATWFIFTLFSILCHRSTNIPEWTMSDVKLVLPPHTTCFIEVKGYFIHSFMFRWYLRSSINFLLIAQKIEYERKDILTLEPKWAFNISTNLCGQIVPTQ